MRSNESQALADETSRILGTAPTDRVPNHLGGIRPAWLWMRSQRYAKRLTLHGLLAAIGFCLIDREGRAVFGRRKADRW